MITIGGRGGDGFHEKRSAFIELFFEYFLECSETYIAFGIVFFGTLGRGIETETTVTRLQSSSDEENDLDIFLLLFGDSIVTMGGIFFLFVSTILSDL